MIRHVSLSRSTPSTVNATTIVSSELLRAVAAGVNADYFETLTGFKWIANGALSIRRAERRRCGGSKRRAAIER